MKYNWQLPDWPSFKYDLKPVENILFEFAQETGGVSGMLKAMPSDASQEAITQVLIAEAIKTSAIEGEFLSRQDVLSSIRNKLGLNNRPETVKDKKALGAGELVVEVRNTYDKALTKKMLFAWHNTLLKDSKTINTGTWRKDKAPMQIVSGTIGKEIVHFEAPPSSKVPSEMEQFIDWFNATAPGGKNEIAKAPVRSAIAHLYFETIHPFEDGNGRIGRAIAEKALSQTIGRPVLLSLSATIEKNKRNYYEALSAAQKKNEITDWITYFVQIVLNAQINAKHLVELTLQKTQYLDKYKSGLNERQLKVIGKMMEKLPEEFEGGMTAKKYMSITHASKATATRDLQEMVEKGMLIDKGGGRSVHYHLNFQD